MIRSTLKKLLGVLCLVIGIIALVTPLTPGAWLILVGIELLGLTFLLPHPIRTRWETFKAKLHLRWLQWTARWRKKPA